MFDIHKLAFNTAADIDATQIIPDLVTFVKEVVENAIDANSTRISIEFTDYGLGGLQIVDNGDGIEENSFSALGRPFHTSKMTNVDNMHSLGYRGEALSSIIQVCGVVVTTATNMTGMGHKLDFSSFTDTKEPVVTPIPRSRGTTMVFTDLWKRYPVRQKHFAINHKKSYRTAVTYLRECCLLYTIELSVAHTVDGQKRTVYETTGESVLENMKSVYSRTKFAEVTEVRAVCEDIEIDGVVSLPKNSAGEKQPNHISISVNGRIVKRKPFLPLIKQLYTRYFMSGTVYPTFIIRITMPISALDLTVDRNKRSVGFKDKEHVYSVLGRLFTDFLTGCNSNRSFMASIAVDTPETFTTHSQSPVIRGTEKQKKRIQKQVAAAVDFLHTQEEFVEKPSVQKTLESFLKPLKKPAIRSPIPADDDELIIKKHIRSSDSGLPIKLQRTETVPDVIPDKGHGTPVMESLTEVVLKPEIQLGTLEQHNEQNVEVEDIEEEEEEEVEENNIVSDMERANNVAVTSKNTVDTDTENVAETTTVLALEYPSYEWLFEDVYEKTRRVPRKSRQTSHTHVLQREDISRMKSVAQFNQGFFICSLPITNGRETVDSAWYVIDQHAAHERLNFEKFQKTKIRRQRLLAPILISEGYVDLTREHRKLLSSIGFEQIDTERGMMLLSVPTIFHKSLDVSNFYEILDALRSATIEEGEMSILASDVVFRTLASKACRSSIMVGESVSFAQFNSILKEMGEYCKYPWMCPHGRSTTSFLCFASEFSKIFEGYSPC
ncbi:hypothetical protein PCE1_003717 [Barthelona sp. PCE]